MQASIEIKNVNAWYRQAQALKNISLSVPKNSIYALIGPSGCGKTTLLRCINRLNDLVHGFYLTGQVTVEGKDIYRQKLPGSVQLLRRNIGMVFQHPNPLPMSILQNMALPVQEWVRCTKSGLNEAAVQKLKEVALYDEVKDRLHRTALLLSGGQQQRLCIARALMLDPSVLLLDEPCSALDPVSTFKIENLLTELKKRYTIVIVTHNMEQAARISDYVAFFYQGEVIEAGPSLEKFSFPETDLLSNYIRGRF